MNIVITGTSSGIGRALAARLLGRGHGIWGLARSDQSDFAAANAGAFHSAVCDVADWAQVSRAADEVAGAWAHVDGLVCCAGLHGEIGRAVTADPIRWSATIRAILDGTYHAVRAFHPMLERSPRRAKVVCFSGGGATTPRPNFSAYGSAKTAVVRLVETIAEEERASAFDINAVAPGGVNTRLTDEIIRVGPSVAGKKEHQAALRQKREGGTPMERVLALVEWLLSPKSDGISGRLISAPWDAWAQFEAQKEGLMATDIYTLRRILPEDRGKKELVRTPGPS